MAKLSSADSVPDLACSNPKTSRIRSLRNGLDSTLGRLSSTEKYIVEHRQEMWKTALDGLSSTAVYMSEHRQEIEQLQSDIAKFADYIGKRRSGR